MRLGSMTNNDWAHHKMQHKSPSIRVERLSRAVEALRVGRFCKAAIFFLPTKKNIDYVIM